MSEILIGIDGTERGEDAAVFGSRLAAFAGARLALANVFPYDDLYGRADDVAFRDALREDALTLLEAVRTRYGLTAAIHGVPARSAASGLHQFAERDAAALLVVGSSHRGRSRRVLPGSTGERLLHGAPCPVAVVPTGYRDTASVAPSRIGCAVDGSVEAAAALRGATELARGLGARLEVIRAFAPDVAPVDERLLDDLERAARTHLKETMAALPHTVDAGELFAEEDPVDLLVRRSHELDILVLGSRGYGPLRSVLLGGVSGRVIREAACPVIVVPRGVDVPLEALAGARSTTA